MFRRPANDSPPPPTISLDGLIVRLQNAGFQLRPDDYSEILQVIAAFPPQTPSELAERIAPLLVTSEEEQQRFYALFAEEQRSGQPVVLQPPKRRRWFVWAGLVGLLVVGLLTWWFWPVPPPDPTTADTPPETSEMTVVVTGEGNDVVKPPERHLVVVKSSGDVDLNGAVNPYHLWGPVGSGLLCAGLGTYLLRRARQRVRREAEGAEAPDSDTRFVGNQPPYELPLPNRSAELVQSPPAFDTVVQTLRQRSEDESSTLNIRRTLAATVRSGGLPELVFSHRLREEEFVFLIDGSRSRSLQRHLFEYYFHALCREGVHAERFFYRVPFGLVYNDRFPDGLRLDQLATRYANSTLLLWGDGYPLLFDDSDVLLPTYLPDLRRFDRRAILTPVPFPDWTYRERALQSEFVLLPADLPGQLRLMQALRDNRADQTTYLETCRGLYPTEDVSFRRVSEVKTYLADDDLFQWLCATAVYGKVRWEVVIEMGHAVLPDPKKLTYTNLLKLARISWLNEGIFPDKLRFDLLKELRPATEQKARERLLDLLYYADVRYPDGYFFDEERYLIRITNQFVLHRHNPDQYANYAVAAQEYEQLWRTNQLPDGTTRLYLDNPKADWDNLIGEGHARVRLGEQLTTETTSESRWQKGWQFDLALRLIGLAMMLGLYAGYVGWQKPAFTLQERQIPYTFGFETNQCLSLAQLSAATLHLSTDSPQDTVGYPVGDGGEFTIPLLLKEVPDSLVKAVFRMDISNRTDSSGGVSTIVSYSCAVDISETSHTLAIVGPDCEEADAGKAPPKPLAEYVIEFFYLNDAAQQGQKLAEKLVSDTEYPISELLFYDFRVSLASTKLTALTPGQARKLNVTGNRVRFDNGNEEEQSIAVGLQENFNRRPSVKARGIRFGLSRVMQQKSPNYISVFITGNTTTSETTPPASISRMRTRSSQPRPVAPRSTTAVGPNPPPTERPAAEVTVPEQTTPPKNRLDLRDSAAKLPNRVEQTIDPKAEKNNALAKYDWRLLALTQYQFQSKQGRYQPVGDQAVIDAEDDEVRIFVFPSQPVDPKTAANAQLQLKKDFRNLPYDRVNITTSQVDGFGSLDKQFQQLIRASPAWNSFVKGPPVFWVGTFSRRHNAFR